MAASPWEDSCGGGGSGVVADDYQTRYDDSS